MAGFAGPDPDGFLHRHDEYLTVADLSGCATFLDGGNHLIVHLDVHRKIELQLGHKTHLVFRTPINLLMTPLAAKALDFTNRHAVDSQFAQGIFDVVELEGFDNRFNLFHLEYLFYRLKWVLVPREMIFVKGNRGKVCARGQKNTSKRL